MSTITNAVANTAAFQNVAETTKKTETKDVKKTRVSGRTVGNPELSEKASKYYEELKAKYSNMDFILVSRDQKEQAQAQAGKYANPNKMVVLIDEDKIERMAEDEQYRKQYEGIIANAATGLSQMKSQLSNSGANVKSYGMKVNDNGTASYFAVLEKASAAQKERIEKKAEEKKEARRAEEKKAAKEAQRERIEGRESDTVTITANSLEELLNKIESYLYSDVQTEEEKQIGQNIDYSI